MSIDAVADEIERLEAAEEITDEDLERLRETLPTDPRTAIAVKRWLPYPFDELFEYHRDGPHGPYWRTAPARDHPNQVAVQERFAEAARQGGRGTVELDGREVQANAAVVAEQLADVDVVDEDDDGGGGRALSRLRDLL